MSCGSLTSGWPPLRPLWPCGSASLGTHPWTAAAGKLTAGYRARASVNRVEGRGQIRSQSGSGTQYQLLLASGATAAYEFTADGGTINFDAYGEGIGQKVGYQNGRVMGAADPSGTLRGCARLFFRYRGSGRRRRSPDKRRVRGAA